MEPVSLSSPVVSDIDDSGEGEDIDIGEDIDDSDGKFSI